LFQQSIKNKYAFNFSIAMHELPYREIELKLIIW